MTKPTRFTLQLTIGLAAIILLLAAGGVFAVRQLLVATTARDVVSRQYANELASAERLRAASEGLGSAARGYLLTGDPSLLADVAEAERQLSELIGSVTQSAPGGPNAALAAEVAAAADGYAAGLSQLVARRQRLETSVPLALEFEQSVMPKRAHLSRAIDGFVGARKQLLAQAEREGHERALEAVWISGAALILSIAFAALFATFIGRKLAVAYRSERQALMVAERAVGARQDLLGMVAHDLRNPLSSIALRADRIRRGVPADDAVELASGIARVANRMNLLISNLVDAASAESGHFSIRRTTCTATSVLHDSAEVLGDLANENGVQLELIDDSQGLILEADCARLAQVVINLGGNAIKFTPKGGRVTLSVVRSGDHAVFTVADTGPGIPGEQQAQLFTRFWTAERQGQLGSGLGLYISKSIVEAHRGTIAVSSSEGHGARFHFTIPARVSVREEPPAVTSGP